MEFNEYYSRFLGDCYAAGKQEAMDMINLVFTFRRYPNLQDLYQYDSRFKAQDDYLTMIWGQLKEFTEEELSEVVMRHILEEATNEIHS